jgi:hypothetical protein
MNGTHPAPELLDRYRRRTATAAETLVVDAHVASCDRCFNAVRADAHLTYDQLEALADGRESASPHLALCAACRGELADLQRMREVLRQEPRAPRQWWWTLAAAAMLAIAVATGLLLFRVKPIGAPPASRGESPPSAETVPSPEPVPSLERPRILDSLITRPAALRGPKGSGAFALHAPVATVVLDDRPRFRWEEVTGAKSYEVAVADLDRGTVAASGTSVSPSWQPTAPLPRGRTYAWQVAATTNRGRVVAPGRDAPEARFHVATQTSVEGSTPLERGVALANLGALDDAERELTTAGADALLDEIRAWR